MLKMGSLPILWTLLAVLLYQTAPSLGQFGNLQFNENPPSYNYDNMPDTSFSCTGKLPGRYYADEETDCQMFHVCVQRNIREVKDFRFLCPNGTVFDQEHQVCNVYYQVVCHTNIGLSPLGSVFELMKLNSGHKNLQFSSLDFGKLPITDPDILDRNILGGDDDFQVSEYNNNNLPEAQNSFDFREPKVSQRKKQPEDIFFARRNQNDNQQGQRFTHEKIRTSKPTKKPFFSSPIPNQRVKSNLFNQHTTTTQFYRPTTTTQKYEPPTTTTTTTEAPVTNAPSTGRFHSSFRHEPTFSTFTPRSVVTTGKNVFKETQGRFTHEFFTKIPITTEKTPKTSQFFLHSNRVNQSEDEYSIPFVTRGPPLIFRVTLGAKKSVTNEVPIARKVPSSFKNNQVVSFFSGETTPSYQPFSSTEPSTAKTRKDFPTQRSTRFFSTTNKLPSSEKRREQNFVSSSQSPFTTRKPFRIPVSTTSSPFTRLLSKSTEPSFSQTLKIKHAVDVVTPFQKITTKRPDKYTALFGKNAKNHRFTDDIDESSPIVYFERTTTELVPFEEEEFTTTTEVPTTTTVKPKLRGIRRKGRRRKVSKKKQQSVQRADILRRIHPQAKFVRRFQSSQTHETRDVLEKSEIFSAEASVFPGGRRNKVLFVSKDKEGPNDDNVSNESISTAVKPSFGRKVRPRNRVKVDEESRNANNPSRKIKRKRLRKVQKLSTTTPVPPDNVETTTDLEATTFTAVTGSTYRPVKRIRVRSKLSKGKLFNNGTVTVRKLRKQSKLRKNFSTTEPEDVTTTTNEPELVTASEQRVTYLRNRDSTSTAFPTFLAVSKDAGDGKSKMKILVKVKKSGSVETNKSEEETVTRSPDYDYAYYDTDDETQIAVETSNDGSSNEGLSFGRKASS